MKLDKSEKELRDSVERGEWKSSSKTKSESRRFQEYARATYKKDRRINIRISSRDMNSLKVRAREQGIPYQTLVSSIIHRYLTGRLGEK